MKAFVDEALPPSVAHALQGAIRAARDPSVGEMTVEVLANHLYAHWYAAPFETAAQPSDLPRDIVAMLRAALPARSDWEQGWIAEEIGRGGYVSARRGKRQRFLDRCEYVVPSRPGLIARPGEELLVQPWRVALDRENGWWYVHSAEWRLDNPIGPLMRVYWHVAVGDVATLAAVATEALLGFSSDWMLKCAIQPEVYCRADAVVLYLQCESIDRAKPFVDSVCKSAAQILRSGVPPLTLQIAQGVAVADDPGPSESFGQHRCRLIAEALSMSDPKVADRDLIDRIAQRFAADGIPALRPFVSGQSRRVPWE
jgi:hypothetical protein